MTLPSTTETITVERWPFPVPCARCGVSLQGDRTGWHDATGGYHCEDGEIHIPCDDNDNDDIDEERW